MNNVQEVILSVFKEVSSICDSHNIPYYAIGGTCIGAIRHKGFIPWDDDIDIAIPIEHYQLFIDIATKELPPHYYILSPNDTVHYPNFFIKVCDDRTTFVMNDSLRYKDSYKGVFIDIMPLSGVPHSFFLRHIFVGCLRLLQHLNSQRRYGTSFLSRLMHFAPYNFFSNVHMRVLKRYPFSKSREVGYVWYPLWLNRLVFPKSFFGNPISMPFEDTEMKCPQNYHKYLTQQFGDYMTLPDESKRESHGGLVDLSKSYREYQNEV